MLVLPILPVLFLAAYTHCGGFSSIFGCFVNFVMVDSLACDMDSANSFGEDPIVLSSDDESFEVIRFSLFPEEGT